VEFVEKMIFQNFFRGKLQFSQHFFFWGGGEIFRGILPGKNVRKIGPSTNHVMEKLVGM
jgi:hypothetical protein